MTQVTIEIEDGAMPKGWEPERIGFPKKGETIVSAMGQKIIGHQVLLGEIYSYPELILRKKYDPGITCIPKGWWVWNDGGEWIASKEVGNWENAVCGLQSLLEFTSTPDGKPQQIC